MSSPVRVTKTYANAFQANSECVATPLQQRSLARLRSYYLLFSLVAFALLAFPCQVDATAMSPSSPPAKSGSIVNSYVKSKAIEWFHRFQTGNIDRAQLSDLANSELTQAMINGEMLKLKPLGTPSSIVFARSYPIRGSTGYDFILQFKKGRVVEMIALDTAWKISGIDFELFLRSR